MCGRFVFIDYQQLIDLTRWHWDGQDPPPWESYNTSPGGQVAAVTNEKPDQIQSMKWWLHPHWPNDGNMKYPTFNARAETLPEKRTFSDPFKKRRCIILANGWFEWTGPKGSKTPNYITLTDRPWIPFAGLWNNSPIKQNGDVEKTPCCTIITCEPHPDIAHLHNRMPVVLREDDIETWLTPGEIEPGYVQHLLEHRPGDSFEFGPVQKITGDNPQNIARLN